MQLEVVVATYQKPEYLRLALSALALQSRLPDGICVADDGSDARAEAVLAEFPGLPLRHVWHEDKGFRKTEILNMAVRTSQADYMVFIDDDCLMHPDVLQRFQQRARADRFLTGSVIRLDGPMTQAVLQAGKVEWAGGRLPGWQPKSLSQRLKSMPLGQGLGAVLDRLSPIRVSWAGGVSGTFRSNILQVNGFDETMAYGGEDKEFGIRLANAGIKGQTLRYSAPVYHLDHGRGYLDPEVQRRNRELIALARGTGKVWTKDGIAR
jgi:GT2 family glycosyltransferase